MIRLAASLPFALIASLPPERQAMIAERLLETNKWNGLATLERMIVQWNRFLTNEERKLKIAKNTIVTSVGKVALTLDIKNVEGGGFNFRNKDRPSGLMG